MTLTTDIHGMPVEVEYSYHKPRRGARDSFNGMVGAGIQLEPDEAAYIEIEEITSIKTGKPIYTYKLPTRLIEELIAKCWEDLGDE